MIICNTGPLLAVANKNDSENEACTAVLDHESGPLIIPAPVVTEVCYMLGRFSPHAEASFLRTLTDGDLHVEALLAVDYSRMADL